MRENTRFRPARETIGSNEHPNENGQEQEHDAKRFASAKATQAIMIVTAFDALSEANDGEPRHEIEVSWIGRPYAVLEFPRRDANEEDGQGNPYASRLALAVKKSRL